MDWLGQGRRWIRVSRALLLTFAVLAVAGLAAGFFLVLPTKLVSADEFKDPADLAKARNDVRTTGVQLLGVLGLLAGGFFTARTIRVNKEGQITDRFTKAINQLGEDKLDVRLGGIFALGRIARDSQADHATIMEVLCAYVRERAPWPPDDSDGEGEAPTRGRFVVDERPGVGLSFKRSAVDEDPDVTVRYGARAPTDVQAIVRVLGRRRLQHESTLDRQRGLLNLQRADLRYVDFDRATLDWAEFQGAALDWAVLARCSLIRADFFASRLRQAILFHADARHADFSGADLTACNLEAADLRGADLSGARLAGDPGGQDLPPGGLRRWGEGEETRVGSRGQPSGGVRDAHPPEMSPDLSRAEKRSDDLGVLAVAYGPAVLTHAKLEGAVCDESTTWPFGFDWEAVGVHPRDKPPPQRQKPVAPRGEVRRGPGPYVGE